MSPTQWALLIVGAVAVIAIYWFSRRERPEARRRRSEAPVKTVKLPGAAPGAGNDQMDMFSRFGEFDEFGVGKPRPTDPASRTRGAAPDRDDRA